MIRPYLTVILLTALLAAAPARAQGVPAEELTSPHKTLSCSDKVTAQSVVGGAKLAFTGRVVHRNDDYTWFRVYVVHKGTYKDRVIKTAGFHGGKKFVAGIGQSFEQGEDYTVALRDPENKREEMYGTPYISALDDCSASVLAKAHDRYGLYRVKPEQMAYSQMEDVYDRVYFLRCQILLTLVVLGAAFGYFRFRNSINAAVAGIVSTISNLMISKQ